MKILNFILIMSFLAFNDIIKQTDDDQGKICEAYISIYETNSDINSIDIGTGPAHSFKVDATHELFKPYWNKEVAEIEKLFSG